MTQDDGHTQRGYLKETIKTMLGGGMVRIELNDAQLDIAIDMAVSNYRQRSANAMEEAWLHLELQADQSTYTLPQEVQLVRKIFRRGHGQMGQTSGANLDPFSLAYANSYMMAAATGGAGGLLTYELQHQFQETLGMMFGREIIFNFNPVSRVLTLHRDVRGSEEVVLWAYHMRPEENLLLDFKCAPWVRDWAIAEAKIMLGRIRGKISAIPGPNGPINLNGDALIQEGKQDQERLIDDLRRRVDGAQPLGFFYG